MILSNCLCQPDYIKDMERFYHFADQLDEKLKTKLTCQLSIGFGIEISIISTIDNYIQTNIVQLLPNALKKLKNHLIRYNFRDYHI